MTDIKNMTDAESVEAVAREVLGAVIVKTYIDDKGDVLCMFTADGKTTYHVRFLTDMNDLQIVKDKASFFMVVYGAPVQDQCYVTVKIDESSGHATNSSEPRAWLEATLLAERGRR